MGGVGVADKPWKLEMEMEERSRKSRRTNSRHLDERLERRSEVKYVR